MNKVKLTILPRFVAVVALLAASSAVYGNYPFPPTVTINQDTTIDAANSYPEPPPRNWLILEITDGMSGPTTVNLVDGGVIGGFTYVTGNSHLVMTGGQIEALTVVSDQATLTMSGGLIAPLIDFYEAAIATSILRLEDSATMHFSGGVLAIPHIGLNDSSVVHFYGRDFRVGGQIPVQTTFLPGVIVEGVFSDGSQFNIRVTGSSSAARVILHTIPEPSGAVIGSISGLFFLLRRLRHRSLQVV